MAETVEDIMVRITANADQVQDTMSKIQSLIEKTVNEAYKTIQQGAKDSADVIKDSTSESEGAVGDSGEGIRDDLKDTSDSFEEMGDKAKENNDQTSNSTKSLGTSISNAGSKIKDALKTKVALGFAFAGAAALSFAKQCVSSAIAAEQSWSRFGGLINSSGGNWADMKKDVKEWAAEFSTQVGYSVGDTREAMTSLMEFGMTYEETQSAMTAVAGIAARTGMSQAEASDVIISALNGRAMALKKYTGLEMDAYKSTSGYIDTEKLLADIVEQTADSVDAHANTMEAQTTRMEGLWASFKSQIGSRLVPVVQIVNDILTQLYSILKGLPDPIKDVIAGFLVVGGGVSTFIGLLGTAAPMIVDFGDALEMVNKAGGVSGIISKVGSAISGFLVSPVGIAIIVIMALVGVMMYLYSTNEQVRDALNNLGNTIMTTLQQAFTTLMQLGQQLYQWLVPIGQEIYGMLVPAFMEISKFAEPLGQAFNDLGVALAQLWATLTGGDTASAGESFNFLSAAAFVLKVAILQVAESIITSLRVAFAIIIPIITGFVQVITVVVTEVSRIAGVFSDLIQGNISVGEAFQQLGNIVSDTTLSIVGVIGTTLMSIFGNLGSIAQEKFGELPGIISAEIGNIGAAISAGAGAVVSAIVQFCSDCIDNFLSTFEIYSPGLMARKMGEEMGHIAEAILNGIGAVVGAIIQFGVSVVTNFINALIGLPAQIGLFLMQIVVTIQTRLAQARNIAGLLVNAIRNAIVTRFNLIVARVRAIFTSIVSAIRSRLTQAFTSAGQLASRIRQVIQQRLQAVVNKVRGIFTQIVSEIRSRLSNAVNTAREKAMEIYNNIKTKISEIPQIVADEFSKIPGKITSALASAASAAASGARDIVSRFASALGINSPGFVQRMTEAEFKSLPTHIRDSGIEAVYQTQNMARNIVNAWERNMDTMTIPIEQFDAFNPALAVDSMLSSENVALLRTDLSTSRAGGVGGASVRSTSNNNVTHDNSSVVYEIQNINLEMGNLTKEQSRRVLYEALDGLYTGGV